MFAALHKHPLLAAWAGGLVSAAALAGLIGLWMLLGGFNTSATSQHSRPAAWAMHSTMQNSVKKRAASVRPPAGFTGADVLAGAHLYVQDCEACHGGPAVDRASWSSGMVPTPPYLLDASRHWSRPELFEILDHGVKMSAMPAWGGVHSKQQLWSIVAFLDALPNLTPAEYARMRAGGAGAARDGSGPSR